ncbi:MAG TPA: carboxylesterase family protein [Longimicrobiales bacterium]
MRIPAAVVLGGLLLVAFAPVAVQAQGAAAAPRVRVAGGMLEGTVAQSGVSMFRGIPFAAPPVGQLRWKAPQPVSAWKGVRPAAGFGPRCMQLPIFNDMQFRSNGVSEDCLYLNVWVPAGAKRGSKLPVLVYYYGGGNVAGDGSEYRYDGESMATKGIVAVTVNYRLGAFGFLAHPELTAESPHHASGNYGLLDQSAALRWVHDNIAAFGGDPARITIGGESAGSFAVSAQMASPLSRALIAGAIGESGAIVGGRTVPLAQAEASGQTFATSLGARSLAELRAIPADSLLRATGGANAFRFGVTVDGWFFPRTPDEIYTAGEQAHVPLLAGWNTQEGFWRQLLGEQEPTPENYTAALRKIFGDVTEPALKAFPGSTPEEVMASGTVLAGARFIAYGTWKWLELQGRTGKPVFRYLYARPRPATVAPSNTPPPTGAVHSAEIEYALGNLGSNKVFAWTPDDYEVSRVMQAYFVNFVKKGDPNGRGLPAWPASRGPDVQTMILDVHPHAQPEPYRNAFWFLDGFYAGQKVSQNR